MGLRIASYKKIIDNLYDGLYFVDQNRIITFWNKAAEKISGYSAAEVIGSCCADNILCHVDKKGNSLCQVACPLAFTMEDGTSREAEVFMHHKDGHRIPVFVRTSPLTNTAGATIGGVELFTDLSNFAANELRVKELEQLALLDPLTQLANRNFLEKEMQGRFEEKKRYQVSFGLLMMDVDHFKNFNDQYGHDVGDSILRLIANTFVANARPFDLYGRWGGEEFIAIIRNVQKRELASIGNRVRTLVEHSFLSHSDLTLHVTISLGATIAKPDDTMKSLIKRADTLLYQSKHAGRNRVTLG